MQSSSVEPPFDQLMETAEVVARDRPEVDPEMAREVFLEAATLLHNGLALDGLDEHDGHAGGAGRPARPRDRRPVVPRVGDDPATLTQREPRGHGPAEADAGGPSRGR